MSGAPGQIGRYRIEAVLGRGAMGVIYRAQDPELDRPVAIKLIRADLLDGAEREEYVTRFRQEAKAAGRCAHPNIVAIYDFALHDGNPFLAMEYVDGINLVQASERGMVFGVDAAVGIVLQVLDALGAAHAHGVVHRDIKPANILLIDGARVKVTDFGISRFAGSQLTQTGSVIGTPSYMSPEQCRGESTDGRSDLFSAGTVLYELIGGARPFPGRNFTEVSQRLLHADPPDLRTRNPAVSPALAAVVAQALAKPPQERFASAQSMADALRAALQGAPVAPTVIMRAPSPGLRNRLDQVALETVERRLAQHVGPIAGHLLRSALDTSASIETLCDMLASKIEPPAERQRFRSEALRQLSGGQPDPSLPRVVLPAAELERAETQLMRFMGPIAPLLVRRSAPGASSEAELWERLSRHIDSDSHRREFLSARIAKPK